MIMYENYQYGNYRRGCGTLKASGGDYGGGSENLICTNTGTVGRSSTLSPHEMRGGGGQRMPDKQNFNSVIDTERLTVRRLTPLECERLQGFPDGWTDIGAWVGENGKSHAESADTARYKALGNSIALPPWAYVLTRLSLCVGCGHPTMASLFDGIGGFPLIWEWLNGKGSCLWASEIEDFPIAVTKYHFPEEGENNEH